MKTKNILMIVIAIFLAEVVTILLLILGNTFVEFKFICGQISGIVAWRIGSSVANKLSKECRRL